MKPLIVLIILISFNIVMAEVIPFSLPQLNIHNFMIQSGSTPYLQGELITKQRVPENNYMEELESRLVEMDILQRCI